MNMLEILATCKANAEAFNLQTDNYSTGLYWARPKSWHGIKMALTWNEGTPFRAQGWEIVPGKMAGLGRFYQTNYSKNGNSLAPITFVKVNKCQK